MPPTRVRLWVRFFMTPLMLWPVVSQAQTTTPRPAVRPNVLYIAKK